MNIISFCTEYNLPFSACHQAHFRLQPTTHLKNAAAAS